MPNDVFGQNFQKNRSNTEKVTITIVHIWNKLGIKFKLKIVNFWAKLTQKGYFWFKKKQWKLPSNATLGLV